MVYGLYRYDQKNALIVSVMRSATRRRSPGKRALLGLTAVILAAGASRRYGEPKQLVRYRGENLLERSIRLARAAGARQVCVVLGYRANAIHRVLEKNRVYLDCGYAARNPRWREGMGRSLAVGIKALPREARAVLVCLSDQPRLQPEDLAQLVAAWRRNPRSVAAARYAGKLGVPAIFPRSWFPRLELLAKDQGAHALLASAKDVVGVPMPRAAFDLDYPEDLSKIPE